MFSNFDKHSGMAVDCPIGYESYTVDLSQYLGILVLLCVAFCDIPPWSIFTGCAAKKRNSFGILDLLPFPLLHLRKNSERMSDVLTNRVS